jgi:hypothetical protein
MTETDAELKDVALELALLHSATSSAKSTSEMASLLKLRAPAFRKARWLYGLRAEISVLFCALVITQSNRLFEQGRTVLLVDQFLQKSRLVVFRDLEAARPQFQTEYSQKIQSYFTALHEERSPLSVSLTFLNNVGAELEIERQMKVIDLVAVILRRITAILERLEASEGAASHEYADYHEALDDIVSRLEAAFRNGSSEGGRSMPNLRTDCELIGYSTVRRVRDLYGEQVNNMAWNSFRRSVEIRLSEAVEESPFNDTLEVHQDGSRTLTSWSTPWLDQMLKIDNLIEARSEKGPLDAAFALKSVGLDPNNFSREAKGQIDEILSEAESIGQAFILPDIIAVFS